MKLAGQHSFSKEERVCGKRDITTLMAEGRWGGSACLRFCCRMPNGLEHSRILVSVPKKHFKRAVKRNLLKRRIREAYRLQKGLLAETGASLGADILFVYNSAQTVGSDEIREAVAAILKDIREWAR